MKKGAEKIATTGYYIQEVLRYQAKYEAGEAGKDGEPPIVAEMLLHTYVLLRIIAVTLSIQVGAFLALALGILLKLGG